MKIRIVLLGLAMLGLGSLHGCYMGGSRAMAAGGAIETPGALPVEEEDTSLRDLPRLDLNEEKLKTPQKTGNDEIIERELKRILVLFGDDGAEVPEVFLNEVKLYVKAFQEHPQYRRFATASLRRSAPHMAMVRNVLAERNIPEDMAYIAFIESGFNPKARSRAGALGMWQFMPGTARNYSLKVTRDADERLDPTQSTYAAADYFHDLIAIFGPRSFLLALAAYNCGENRIIACLKRIENPFEERTFWHIRPCLAAESREYPPKVIAAAIIGHNPEVFGFPRFDDDATPEDRDIMEVRRERSSGQGLRTVALTAGVQTRETLAHHKPESPSIAARTPPLKPFVYTVMKGNTLNDVSEAFGVRVDDVTKWNRIRKGQLLSGTKLKLYRAVPVGTVSYTVRKGDTVRDIAQSFGVRPVRIVVANGLRNGFSLKQGKQLVLYRDAVSKPVVHVVRKGSNLTVIADRFDVRVKDIMRWNDLESATIHPDQKLTIYPDVTGA
jgi:membrane-bound lytic murein transglycosylase D